MLDAPPTEQVSIEYGWRRLLLCFLLPGLLARALGGSGQRYVRAFLLADIALLAGNLIVDRGPGETLRQFPDDAGIRSSEQKRHGRFSWLALIAGGALMSTAVPSALATAMKRLEGHPADRLLNWTPVKVEWFVPSELSFRQLLLLDLPLNVLAEESYVRGLLWSRMAWLGPWRPLVNGTAWAFYHVHRPIKEVAAGILPGGLVLSYLREFTGNIYWTAAVHYISNAFFSWLALRKLSAEAATAAEEQSQSVSASAG